MMVADDKGNGRSRTIEWMEIFSTVTTFVFFNLLWIFGALFVITIPAVTAALFACLVPWTRGRSPYKPLTMFGRALQRYWFKATVVAILDLLAAGFLILNLLILRQMGTEQLLAILALMVTGTAALLLILVNVYLWPLLVTVDPPLRALLKNAARLAIMHPFWGLLVALLAAVPLVISLFLPGVFLLTLTFAAPALIIQWGAWRIIKRYFNDQDLQDLGVS